jgi:hypothetical protein
MWYVTEEASGWFCVFESYSEALEYVFLQFREYGTVLEILQEEEFLFYRCVDV